MSGERIGRYTVERSLARGGMAEVFLAKAEGPGGFQKSVVIKRILPDLAEDDRFIELFRNEARLAALLNHPNIVQVFDFGEDDGAYFIAMEYIQGESVRNALYHYRDVEGQFPIRAAAQIAIGICEGLQYAHDLCDENGVSYNIIHRDVTPENILISASGIPKIVDFGIAKATSNTTKTEAGTVKGKYAYMSPEQVRGAGADRRLDVYAVGVCLYEMLSGQKPFAGEALALLHAIIEGRFTPLSEVNPAVPRELSDIVSTAMACEPANRFPDAHRMGDALEDWLLATGRRVAAVELAQLVAEVARGRKSGRRSDLSSGPKGVPGFPPEGVKTGRPVRREPEPSAPGSVPEAAAPPAPREPINRKPPDDLERTPAAEAFAASEAETKFQPAATTARPVPSAVTAEVPEEPVARLPRRSSPALALTIATVLGLLGAAGWFALHRGGGGTPLPSAPIVARERSKSPPPPPAETPIPTPPLPPLPTSVATPAPTVAPAPSIAAAPPTPRFGLAVTDGPVRTEHAGAPSAFRPRQGPGYLTIRSSPWCDVYLDGSKIGVTPISHYEVPAGKHGLLLKNDVEGASRKLTVDVAVGKEAKEAVVFGHGTLDVRVQPWAQVFLDGKALGPTPLEPLEVFAGTHELRLVNHDLGKEETRRVAVREGRREVVKVFW
ncbi:MAG: protein kinase domain-containing protein [Myxococcales bacterium]